MSFNIAIENMNKFLSLIVRRIGKDMWHTFPERTKKVFYNNKDIDKYIVKEKDIIKKMFFANDIGFTACIVMFPNDNCAISDIPELSEYYFKIENKIKATEKQLELKHFAICTRELGVYFYNMSQNSNNKYFALKQDFKLLEEATQNLKKQNFKSATEAQKNAETRENILNFVLNLLIDLHGNHGNLSFEHITILFHLRAYNETGVKSETILGVFKGSVGQRMVQKYISELIRIGYMNRSGKKKDTLYMLSSKGMLFVNDWADRVLSL